MNILFYQTKKTYLSISVLFCKNSRVIICRCAVFDISRVPPLHKILRFGIPLRGKRPTWSWVKMIIKPLFWLSRIPLVDKYARARFIVVFREVYTDTHYKTQTSLYMT